MYFVHFFFTKFLSIHSLAINGASPNISHSRYCYSNAIDFVITTVLRLEREKIEYMRPYCTVQFESFIEWEVTIFLNLLGILT